ncbi:glutamine synthetase adenylyltransferase [bacterium]|nr:glutamine synthetase adenylyltransferase [bacterium]
MARWIERQLQQLESDPVALEHSLRDFGFHDTPVAAKRLRYLMSQGTDAEATGLTLATLLAGLRDTPTPDGVLLNFERYLAQTQDPTRTYRALADRPRAIEILLKLFIGSQYLTETLLRSPEYLERLILPRELADIKSREDFQQAALEAAQQYPDQAGQLDALRRYQRWEILRIGVCDNVGLIDLRSSTIQLSLLADALIRVCLQLVAKPGDPIDSLVILGMGKLGGEELNYSSDIDLIFLADQHPEQLVPVAQRLIRALQSATGEGFLYRVDMRLRPWGRAGSLVTSTNSFLEYLKKDAELWERQALVKARQISGDRKIGQSVLDAAYQLVIGDDPIAVRNSVRDSKERIEAELDRRGKTWGEVKSGTGSIRDIEFLAQYLQIVHGHAQPHLRTANTLEALIRLTDAGLLQADEYRHLTGGYVFLRTIEHALQLMHNKQVHRLPTDSRELNYLAQRLDFSHGEAFVAHYERHCRAIRKIYDRHLGVELPASPATVAVRTSPVSQFSEEQRALHRKLLSAVTADQPVQIEATLAEGPVWHVTVAGIDQPGDLSMICGLLFVYGFDILDGLVTTGWYPETWSVLQKAAKNQSRSRESPRDFIDVFTVRPPLEIAEPSVWVRYQSDLTELFRMLRDGRDDEAHGRLANRVAAALEEPTTEPSRLSPVSVQIDNDSSATSTVLQIQADDSLGFLYELSNALSLSDIDIQQVIIRSEGQRVFDTLHVNDARNGRKITDLRRLQQLQAAVVLIKHFTHLLPHAPNPEAALLHFRSFVQELFQQPNWWEEWSALEQPEVLEALARVLGVSDYLWEDVLRLQYGNLFPLLRDQAALRHRKSRAGMAAELRLLMADTSTTPHRVQVLNEFKDREMFRTDMRHILGYISEFNDFAAELTDLAEIVVSTAAEIATTELQDRFGQPTDEAQQPVAFSICALGKCGGRELGFASDIELLFLYTSEGQTTGPEVIPNATYFQRFVELFTQSIKARREGIFHIDLRLRPYGKAGPVATSVTAFENYYSQEGPAWPYERQALVKLRPIAGDPDLGQALVKLRDRLIYTGAAFDPAAIRAMRERQVRQLVRAGTFHAKLSPGGLVDLEYLAQALQLLHGHKSAAIRTPNTYEALQALAQAKVIAAEDIPRATAAYIFFRRLIDALRMVRGNAQDLTVPSSRSEEFEFLSRRLGAGSDVARVKAEMQHHSQQITELVRKYLPADIGAT